MSLNRLKKLEAQLNPPPPKTYILKIQGWQFGEPPYDENEFGSFYWLMEDDDSPKGKFIRPLTRKEAEKSFIGLTLELFHC